MTSSKKANKTTQAEDTPEPLDDDLENQPAVAEDTVEAGEATSDDGSEGPDDSPGEEVAVDDSQDAEAVQDEAQDIPQPPSPEVIIQRRGGFVPVVAGGAVVAALAFGAAQYQSQSWPFENAPDVDYAPLIAMQTDRIATQADRIAALEQALGTLAQTPEAISAVEQSQAAQVAAIDDAHQAITLVEAEQAAVETRLTDLERRPVAGSDASEAAIASYQRELEVLTARLDALQADGAARDEATQMSLAAVAQRSALAQIDAALVAGGGFEDALETLTNATDAEIPDALRDNSAGVETLEALSDSFPAAARSALDAAIVAGVEDGSVSRFSAFFRRQLGLRSLEASDDDGPDAILSRAEAALSTGDLASALAELESFPEAGRGALNDWQEATAARLAALDGAARLARSLDLN